MNVDRPAVRADDVVHDVQAETDSGQGADPARAPSLPQRLEQVREQLGGDGGAPVVDLEPHPAVASERTHRDRRSWLAVLAGVRDEVLHDLNQPGWVPVPLGVPLVLELHRAVGVHRLDLLGRAPSQLVEVHEPRGDGRLLVSWLHGLNLRTRRACTPCFRAAVPSLWGRTESPLQASAYPRRLLGQ